MINLPMPTSALRLTHLRPPARNDRWQTQSLHSLPTHLLLWIIRGQGRLNIEGRTRGYSPNHALFIPAGCLHSYELGIGTTGTAVYIDALSELEYPTEPVLLRVTDALDQSILNAKLGDIQRELSEPRADQAKALHFHSGLLSVWLYRALRQLPNREETLTRSERLTRDFCRLMENQHHNGWSIAQYAEEMGMTPTHLSRLCNKTCGVSASALLIDRVFHAARLKLMGQRQPVKEIAQVLGFQSAAYFSRAFCHYTGQSPTAFRDESQRNDMPLHTSATGHG